MKTFVIVVAIILAIFGLLVFVHNHTEEYQIKGVCKKTIAAYDHRSLVVDYTVIIQYEDGEVDDIPMTGESFFKYKEGQTYYFNRTRWVWDKKK